MRLLDLHKSSHLADLKYCSTLATSTLIILFSEMLKFLNFFFPGKKNCQRKIENVSEDICFCLQSKIINLTFKC
jgi:hypothetical protein